MDIPDGVSPSFAFVKVESEVPVGDMSNHEYSLQIPVEFEQNSDHIEIKNEKLAAQENRNTIISTPEQRKKWEEHGLRHGLAKTSRVQKMLDINKTPSSTEFVTLDLDKGPDFKLEPIENMKLEQIECIVKDENIKYVSIAVEANNTYPVKPEKAKKPRVPLTAEQKLHKAERQRYRRQVEGNQMTVEQRSHLNARRRAGGRTEKQKEMKRVNQREYYKRHRERIIERLTNISEEQKEYYRAKRKATYEQKRDMKLTPEQIERLKAKKALRGELTKQVIKRATKDTAYDAHTRHPASTRCSRRLCKEMNMSVNAI